jgi:hypothetical protein
MEATVSHLAVLQQSSGRPTPSYRIHGTTVSAARVHTCSLIAHLRMLTDCPLVGCSVINTRTSCDSEPTRCARRLELARWRQEMACSSIMGRAVPTAAQSTAARVVGCRMPQPGGHRRKPRLPAGVPRRLRTPCRCRWPNIHRTTLVCSVPSHGQLLLDAIAQATPNSARYWNAGV